MTARLIVAAALVVVAGTVAWWLERRVGRARGPVRTNDAVPHQVDRADFPRPDAPWLVVVFTSTTCGSCRLVAERVAALAGPTVATAEVPVEVRPEMHLRYGIDAVPTTVVADGGGVVRASFLGEVASGPLEAAVEVMPGAG